MKRLLPLAGLGLVLAGCGWGTYPGLFCANCAPKVMPSPPFVTRMVPPSPTSLRFSTSSNRSFAAHDAQRLLRVVVLPTGARRVAAVPRSAPARFRNNLPARFLPRTMAVARRIWIVPERLARVLRFAQAHVPTRPRPIARFRGSNSGVRLRVMGSYPFPPVPGRSWQRWLNVEMTALPAGRTAVIAQAGVAWIHKSPRSALLPEGVRRIDIVRRLGEQRPNVLVHVHNRYDVGVIVSWINGLGLASAAHVTCLLMPGGGPRVTLRFRAADGKVLAHAIVSDDGLEGSTPCDPLWLTIASHKVVPLVGADLLHRLHQLFGIGLAPRTPSSEPHLLGFG